MLVFALVWPTLSDRCWYLLLCDLHWVAGVGLCSCLTYTEWQVLVFVLVWHTLSDRWWSLLLCDLLFYVFVLSCVCYVFMCVCLNVLCGHLLGKGWPLGSRSGVLLWACHFPFGILGQVWYLIVSIPDLCILTYFTLIDRCWSLLLCDLNTFYMILAQGQVQGNKRVFAMVHHRLQSC